MIRMRDVFVIAMLTALWTSGAVAQDYMKGDTGPAPGTRPRKAAPAAKARPAIAPDLSKPPAPVIVETSVDRTAVWIGDPIVYTIRITCPPGTDILAADISPDRLKLTGLDLTDSTQQRDVLADGKVVYRTQFRLVSFESEGATATIERQAVRYYVHTAGQPLDTLAPADEVQLPVRAVTVHSTLPNGTLEWLRDAPRVAILPAALAYSTQAGMLAVVLTLIPVILGLAGIVRTKMPRRTVRSRRETTRLRRQALADIRAADTTDADRRRDALDKLNALIRDRLTDFRIPAQSLTADEIEQEIAGRLKRVPADGVVATLRHCERAVYGEADELPGPEAVSAAVEQAERLLAARVR